MSTYLPVDVLLEILSRLPSKSQIRFRCVSKTWHEIIGNPDFVSKNLFNDSILTTTQENPSHLLLTVKSTENSAIIGGEVLSCLSYETLECVSQTLLTPGLKLIASCKGLLCLGSYFTSDVYVWNPATPSVGLKPLPLLTRARPSCWFQSFKFDLGFGYDSRSNDFKAVCIRLFCFQGQEPSWICVDVCSLSGGSWRVVGHDVLCPAPFAMDSIVQQARPAAALDGVFIWRVPGHQIAAFDFTDEVLRTTPLPDGGRLSEYDYFVGSSLTFLNGHVSLLAFSRSKFWNPPKCSDLEIWVLLEFGVKESWTRLTTIGLSIDFERPLGFWKRGELLTVNREGQLVLYDPFTRTKKNLHVVDATRTLDIVLHTPSSIAVNL
jgi:F-box interacting protein